MWLQFSPQIVEVKIAQYIGYRKPTAKECRYDTTEVFISHFTVLALASRKDQFTSHELGVSSSSISIGQGADY